MNMPQDLIDGNNKAVLLCDTVHRTSRELINPIHPLKFNSEHAGTELSWFN